MSWLQKIAQMMTIQDIPNFIQESGGIAFLKYVRVNGEYRFSDATTSIEHSALAHGDPVESAAFVKIYPDGLYVDGNSTTLKIGPMSDDEENLSTLLNIAIKDRW